MTDAEGAAREAELLLEDWELVAAGESAAVMAYVGDNEEVLPLGDLARLMGQHGLAPDDVMCGPRKVSFAPA